MDILRNVKFPNIPNLFFGFCFIVLFPLGEVFRITFGNGVALTALDIGLVLLLCLWISQNWLQLINLKLQFQKTLLIFIAACILSLVLNALLLPLNEILIASLYLIRWVLYASLYLMVVTGRPELKKKIRGIMLVSGGLVLLVGYVQFFFYPALRNLLYLGWDEHYYRMFGSFFDPNFLGAFLVLYLVFVVGFFLSTRPNKPYPILRSPAPVNSPTGEAISSFRFPWKENKKSILHSRDGKHVSAGEGLLGR